MEDLQSNNKLQGIMSKLAILKSDTQIVISKQELYRNKPNIDDDIIDKKIIEMKTNIDNKPNIGDDSDDDNFDDDDDFDDDSDDDNFDDDIDNNDTKTNIDKDN